MKDNQFKSREVLMQESLNEFGMYSYKDASLNRIIKNAKVSKGSFYYHFKNKEDLYTRLILESVNAKWCFISQYAKENAKAFDKMDIFDKFLYQAKAGILFGDRYPGYSRLANMFEKEKGSEIYESVMALIDHKDESGMKLMISQAYGSGELDQSFELNFVTHLIEKLFTNYYEFFNASNDVADKFENLEEFIRFMRNGLGK